MKRWIIGIFGAALVLSAGYLLLSGGRTGEMVRVYRAGEVLWESPLHRDGVFQAPHNRVEVAGGRVRISVTDTGEGIPPDKLRDIWERYYKVDREHRRTQVGTGLGLSIVKNVLDLHGGRYGVISELGRGSTFWFELTVA